MNLQTSTAPQPEIAGYDLVEQLYLGSRTAVYRAMQIAQPQSVVIKMLRSEYPSFGELVQFRNQYTIAKSLSIPGIVQPLSLEPLGSGYALVMEDWGGISLDTYLQQQSLTVTDGLAIALQIADILHELSQHQVVHKDIKPANILIHPASKQVKLIDFSIASLLPKETQEIQSPNVLEGTLAYLAPEQTGRMNRGIDYRADFYALGVTLYQLLSGRLPFDSKDPLELVHCHIAKLPIPVNQVNAEIPAMVAAIVTKLMAKNAEDRYQSAIGLQHDLQQCLTQWKETGEISAFELGQRDWSDRFLIPEKLYGREAEVQALLDAFERVAGGSSELMLVAGFSGIGKTAIVNEVHKPITRQNGYFIKGKFDQFNRNIPLSAFAQAFRDLLTQLLSESDVQLQTWKRQILANLGDSSQVLIDVIPELERLIGSQPPATELSGTAAQNRFNLLFQKFIQVFTTPEHPLVMFLDDLQWADSASLNLIQVLMAESTSGHLLLIGAYRDNEVFAAHPLMLTLDTLSKAGVNVNTIALQPLSQPSLNQLIADTLHCADRLAQPLTELVFQKTQGNPFFATQFLKALHQEKLITFDANAGYWQCDRVRVQDAVLTDDVVEFMALQLQKLPEATQTVLKLAACIGAQFDLQTLAIVSEQSQPEAAAALWKALQEGLILPQSEVYKFYLENETRDESVNQEQLNYKFLHDRVQQVAYCLIPDNQKSVTHLGIGQLLLKQTLPENLDKALFAIVSQFNLGTDCLTSPNDRSQVAHLNLAAARKARLSAAYGAAAQYSEMALQLVTDVWLQQPTFALDLYHEAANSACLIGDFERVDTYIAAIFQQVSNPLDQIKILEVQIQSLIARNRLEEALQVARTILQKLSVTLPEHPTAEMMPSALESIRQQLAGIGDVTDLAPMRDPAKLAAMSILSSMASAAYIGSPALYPLIVLKQIELSLQFGNTLETPYAYATYGLILSAFGGEIAAGNRSADIAIALMEKLQAFRFKSKILNLVYPFTRIWQESIRSTLEPLREGYQAGLESGDLEFAAYCAYNRCKLAYAAGTNLLELQIEMQRYGEVIAQLKQTTALNFHQIGQQAVLNWLGMTTQPQHLIGTAYDETVRLLDHQAAGDVYSIGTFYAHKLILTYHFAQPQEALEIGRIAETKISGIIGTAFYGIFRFYHALTLLANELIPLSDRDLLTADIAEDLGCLEHWAIHAPMNFAHRCDLVRAEQERTLGHHAAAIDLYDRAIAGAKANEYIQEEALANELAAKFYLDWGKEKVAAGYMQEAYYCYARWGAKAKIDDLETRYPQLLRPILQAAAQSLNVFETLASIAAPHPSLHSSTPSSRSSSTSINTALDFAAILKASQSLASTLQLDELLHQLSQLILQNSGGDRSILLLQNPTGEWFVEAVAIPDNTDRCSEPLEGNINVPTQLIQYVKNTQATVTINDGKTELPVVGSYFNQRQPKSVLCLPILNQSQLMGMLYLENQATSGVFTRDRILVLNFLCTQAAISIKNARHYTQAQTSQHQLATLLSNLTGMAYSCQNDANWTMLFVSQGCLEMTGYTPEEFIHNRSVAYASLIHPDDVEFLDDTVQASLAQQCPFQVTYRITTKQGQEKWVWEQGRGVFDANGQFIALEGLITDISDRKQAEAIILQKSQALECALAEVQTTQLQMVQNEKMASLGNLVVGVAHEINNPIGFLNGSINNAKDYVRDLLGHLALYQQHHPNPAAPIQDHAEDIDLEYLSEDLPKLLASMKGATDRIKGISTSLRTFSRADTEYKVSANLHEGLDSTLLILKYRLKGNEHRPEIQVIPQYGDLPAIQCFPGQLNQVFMNILANAIDMFDELAQQFTLADLQANPQILTLQTTLADSNTAEIRIRDNGKGMSEALAARIFDHLFTTKGVGKGTGLGLAIARQIIVEKHGGSLEVQSELGQGSEFYIRLPIHAE